MDSFSFNVANLIFVICKRCAGSSDKEKIHNKN